MRFFSCALVIFLGAGLILGCGESGGKPMKNQVPGTGPAENVDIKGKGGKVKPMPEDDAPPAPPPLPGKPK